MTVFGTNSIGNSVKRYRTTWIDKALMEAGGQINAYAFENKLGQSLLLLLPYMWGESIISPVGGQGMTRCSGY